MAPNLASNLAVIKYLVTTYFELGKLMIAMHDVSSTFKNVVADIEHLLAIHVFAIDSKLERVYRVDSQGREYVVKPKDIDTLGLDTLKIELDPKDPFMQEVSQAATAAAKLYAPSFLQKKDLQITCHIFIAQKGGYSFATHTDPTNLLIFCYDGSKTMEVDGQKFKINKGYGLFMSENIPHRALNEHASIMFSIGYE